MTNIMCCNLCGRANIVCDAAAVWSPAGQIWVLDEVFDEAWCDDCESDVAVVSWSLAPDAVTSPLDRWEDLWTRGCAGDWC